MERELTNTVTVGGNYNDIPTSISSEAVVVTMLDGLTVTKSADKSVWADGALTYTVEVNNETTVNYTEPVITDTLNTTLVSFVVGSVTINGEKMDESKYTYSDATVFLTINLDTISPSSKSTITFQVTKKV